MKNFYKYSLGYIVGGGIFLLFIPYGFYKVSTIDGIDIALIGNDIIRYIISSLVFFIGACFMLWSNIFLYRMGKGGPSEAFGVSISPITKKLVTTGPYRFSRNPMVFGALSLYTSVVVLCNSVIGSLCLIVFIILVTIYLKFSEEKRLIKDFGDEYIDYRKKVSMILPLKRFKDDRA